MPHCAHLLLEVHLLATHTTHPLLEVAAFGVLCLDDSVFLFFFPCVSRSMCAISQPPILETAGLSSGELRECAFVVRCGACLALALVFSLSLSLSFLSPPSSRVMRGRARQAFEANLWSLLGAPMRV